MLHTTFCYFYDYNTLVAMVLAEKIVGRENRDFGWHLISSNQHTNTKFRQALETSNRKEKHTAEKPVESGFWTVPTREQWQPLKHFQKQSSGTNPKQKVSHIENPFMSVSACPQKFAGYIFVATLPVVFRKPCVIRLLGGTHS